MTIVILGATGGVGRALAHELAKHDVDLLLIGRNEQKLSNDAKRLRAAHFIKVEVAEADAELIDDFAERFAKACEGLERIEALLCPIGASYLDDDASQPLDQVKSLLDVNLVATIIAVEIVLPRMRAADYGAIVGFSSIAAARGRGANVIYAAAKRALESYFESLRHKLVGTRIQTSVYRLGYVATQQNEGKTLLFPQATAYAVARHVIAHMHRTDGRITFPAFWLPITLVLRILPWRLFKKLKF